MYEIKTAGVDDIPQLSEILAELFSQEKEFMPEDSVQQKGLEQIITRPETGTVFKLYDPDNGFITGMVSLLYTVSTALGGKAAILEDLIIRKEYRALGLGTKLLSAALKYAEENGILRITLLTDSENQKAHQFYAKHGFSKSTMIPMRYFPEK